MQSSRQIRQYLSRFVVRMRRDVENARRDACALNCLDRLRKTRPGPRRGRELRGRRQASNTEPKRKDRSEEHTSELQSRLHLVCRLLLEKKKKKETTSTLL